MSIVSQIDKTKAFSEIKLNLSKYNASRLMHLMISGSHLYGFPSKDSDMDIRGSFLINTNALFGLTKPRDLLRYDIIGGFDVELSEIKKEVNMALSSNCNVLEHLFAPQEYADETWLKLRELIPICKDGLYHSYRGMAHFNYKKFILGGKKTTKKYLYILRALLCGIYALRMGEINPNIIDVSNGLRDESGHRELIDTLVNFKKVGIENELLVNKEIRERVELAIDKLFKEIEVEYIESELMEKPTKSEIEEIETFIKHIRVDNLL